MIITEGELDDIFIPFSQMVQHNLTPACNIYLGCYGLFLVGLDLSDDPVIQQAIEHLEDIADCVLFGTLAVHYPPEDITIEGIRKLARTIVVISTVTQGKCLDDIPVKSLETLDRAIHTNLGIKESTIQMEPECLLNSLPTNLSTTSSTSTTVFLPEN